LRAGVFPPDRPNRASTTPRAFIVVAAGKAAWPMAHALARLEPGLVRRGVIAGPRVGAQSIDSRFEWFDAGHPFPNDASVGAARAALALARDVSLSSGDAWLVVLLSGGASAMLAAPVDRVTLEDKIAVARSMMRAGRAIDALNCVRKHLSIVKGGRLAAAATRSLTLAISDVHGPVPDDPSVIGSGPTVADPTTFAQAADLVRQIPEIPLRVREYLDRGLRGEVPETIKPGDTRLSEAHYTIIGNRETALAGARAAADALGYPVSIVEGPIRGEARDASHAFVAHARHLAHEAGRPLCVLGSGETTVTVESDGLGGRNQEFALAATPGIGSLGRAAVLASAGTDGIDGPTDAAGAVVDSTTLERAQRAGLDWQSTLARNDAYHFFQPLGDLIMWGPTGTNVGDVHVLLVA
jgi:glycerate 2-kinase